MSNRLFGWDLPPGCTNADIERQAGADMSEEEGTVRELLEEAGVDRGTIDRIAEVVDSLASKECTYCVQRENRMLEEVDRVFGANSNSA